MSGKSYLIGTKKAEEIFNRWWEIGSMNDNQEGKEGKGKSKEDVDTEESEVGNRRVSAEYVNEPRVSLVLVVKTLSLL